MDYQTVINFWFEEIDRSLWWKKDPRFDESIRDRFLDTHRAAALGETFNWRATAEGRLAEIIVLDQFSRNMFRDTPKAFAYDPIALVLAQEAIANQADEKVPEEQRFFFYMPFMHSESALIHQQAVELFSKPGMENNLDFEHRHKAIIDQFGRYPHRNKILGRESTQEEVEFLKKPGSSF